MAPRKEPQEPAQDRPQLDRLRQHLDGVILAVLADGPAHGYALIQEVRRRSGDAFDLPEGTLYPALHRLEGAGLVSSEWERASGRRRRSYTLTRRGRAALDVERESWRSFATSLSRVMGVQPWPA
ncbi:MAG: helix-turn-helix transcriptional regulator [Acidimicrobiia bacterium]